MLMPVIVARVVMTVAVVGRSCLDRRAVGFHFETLLRGSGCLFGGVIAVRRAVFVDVSSLFIRVAMSARCQTEQSGGEKDDDIFC